MKFVLKFNILQASKLFKIITRLIQNDNYACLRDRLGKGGKMARKTKPVDFIDPETGEVQQGTIFWSENRPNRLTGGFAMIFQEAFIALACDNDLTPQAQRVLLYLLGKLDFDNFIHITQKEIGEALKINAPNMSKAMTMLKNKEIILLAPYKGVNCYKLNAFYGWRGSVSNFQKEREKPKLTIVK